MTYSNFIIGSGLLMLAAGFGIPMMANLNAGLGTKLGNPLSAVVVLTGVTFLTSSLVLIASGGVGDFPNIAQFKAIPKQYFLGGVLFVFYISSITWAAPKIGLGNAIFIVLLGQLSSAVVIDHFGLFGAIKSTITPKRALGLFVMAVGLYLAQKDV
ncbi:DMT family transporter [Hirschia litorea]|uniref:DMT family transporter n=1 Tax=Hirschia litorea TaxID=1199156 RepID=A0ABW2IKS7_9PROT